jgi:hypothetical protein
MHNLQNLIYIWSYFWRFVGSRRILYAATSSSNKMSVVVPTAEDGIADIAADTGEDTDDEDDDDTVRLGWNGIARLRKAALMSCIVAFWHSSCRPSVLYKPLGSGEHNVREETRMYAFSFI